MTITETTQRCRIVNGCTIERGADLSSADLSSADLSSADLSSADLRGAYLSSADLSSADLRGADLSSADLRGANLRGADLRGADLRGADLSSADLRGANLRGANLRGADLSDTKLPAFQIPQEGSLVVFKKVRGPINPDTGLVTPGRAIIKLLIPENAKRTATPTGRKCRAEYAVVLEGSGVSAHDGETVYAPGMTIKPDSYDPDIRVECTHGIHFFLTCEEAEEY